MVNPITITLQGGHLDGDTFAVLVLRFVDGAHPADAEDPL